MKLTKKRAVELSIELWTWLAETGRGKKEWPGWGEFGGLNYCGELVITAGCFLCEYDGHWGGWCGFGERSYCPYFLKFGHCNKDGRPFGGWDIADRTNDVADRKKYASLFLEQLKAIRRG